MAIRNQLPTVREVNRLQHRIDRMFDDFLSEPFLEPGEESFIPACDIEESDTQYRIDFDLPGVKKNDVKIEIRGNQLTVSGERRHEREEKSQGRTNRERFYGSFVRSFALPTDVRSDQVEASYEDGVLQITVPKTPETSSKQIPIREKEKAEKAA